MERSYQSIVRKTLWKYWFRDFSSETYDIVIKCCLAQMKFVAISCQSVSRFKMHDSSFFFTIPETKSTKGSLPILIWILLCWLRSGFLELSFSLIMTLRGVQYIFFSMINKQTTGEFTSRSTSRIILECKHFHLTNASETHCIFNAGIRNLRRVSKLGFQNRFPKSWEKFCYVRTQIPESCWSDLIGFGRRPLRAKCDLIKERKWSEKYIFKNYHSVLETSKGKLYFSNLRTAPSRTHTHWHTHQPTTTNLRITVKISCCLTRLGLRRMIRFRSNWYGFTIW